jgi:alkaline phosphatase D
MKPNRPPSEGRQFFGIVRIDGESQAMTVTHYNVAGEKLWETELEAT